MSLVSNVGGTSKFVKLVKCIVICVFLFAELITFLLLYDGGMGAGVV